MRAFALLLVLLAAVGCEKPLKDRLREAGYENVVEKPDAVCFDGDLDQGWYGERGGHAWEIAKCCDVNVGFGTGMCGGKSCLVTTVSNDCAVVERDLGPLWVSPPKRPE